MKNDPKNENEFQECLKFRPDSSSNSSLNFQCVACTQNGQVIAESLWCQNEKNLKS